MESVPTNKPYVPMPLAELFPGLSSILSKDARQTLSAKKQPRSTIPLTRTTVKNFKPLTIAEMRADILALRVPSPRTFAQPSTSAKKKIWNSSVKVDNKTKSHTTDGQLKHSSVRKVLNFQPKPKAVGISKLITPEETNFPKPQMRAKKTFHLQAKSTVRISGVCNMPQTPFLSNAQNKNRMTLANKENYLQRPKVIHQTPITPAVSKKRMLTVVDTPLANLSQKSGNDTSFLEREKEVQDIEDKNKVLVEEPMLENIAEISPPISTPFKEYRSVQDFFNHSNDTENSALYHDNTIMCFDKTSQCKENNKQEESVIFTLCDLFNKASVANVDESFSTEPSDLLEVEKQLKHNLLMIENGIKMLTNIKESQIKSLCHVKKIIKERKSQSEAESLTKSKDGDKPINVSPVPTKPCSVIKNKSPSYKIPKKNQCLRKQILYKSMPSVSDKLHTPNKDMDKRAFDMYMKMKMNEMNFLSTPCVKHRNLEIPNTPTMTSHNLQMQLNKIYNNDT